MSSRFAPRRGGLIPAVLLAAAAGCAGGGASTRLAVSTVRLSFGPSGTACTYHMKTNISSNDRGIQRDMQVESRYQATVDSIGQEGHLYMSFDLDEFSVAKFVQGNVAYDEASEAFVGQTLRLTMTPEGDVVRRQGLNVPDLLTPEGRSLKDVLTRLFSLRSQRFPQEVVRVGDSWTRALVASQQDQTMIRVAGGMMEGKLTRTYQVVSFVIYKGRSCAQLQVTTAGEYTGEGMGQRGPVTLDVDVEGSGTVYYDYENHCIVSEKEKTKVTQRGTRPPDRPGEEGKVEELIIDSEVEITLESKA